MLLGPPATLTSSLASGEHRLRSYALGGTYGGAKVAPPATTGEPRPDPPLGTPVGTGLMGVHKDHPPCGVTGVSAIRQVADISFAPPLSPPAAHESSSAGDMGETSSSTRDGGSSSGSSPNAAPPESLTVRHRALGETLAILVFERFRADPGAGRNFGEQKCPLEQKNQADAQNICKSHARTGDDKHKQVTFQNFNFFMKNVGRNRSTGKFRRGAL